MFWKCHHFCHWLPPLKGVIIYSLQTWKVLKKHDTSTQGSASSTGYNSPLCVSGKCTVGGDQGKPVHIVVGPLWNVTAWSLIIPRNVRIHWTQLGFTVQGLINSKSTFLGYLICNSWSFIFLSLFKNSFSNLVAGEKAVQQICAWKRALQGCSWGTGGQGCPHSGPHLERQKGQPQHVQDMWRKWPQPTMCLMLPLQSRPPTLFPQLFPKKIFPGLTNLIKCKITC